MWKAGQLPVPAEQLLTGTIIVRKPRPWLMRWTLRRSFFAAQRRDWEAQLGRRVVYAHNHRVTMVEAVSELDSGLNGRRPKLLKPGQSRDSDDRGRAS
jgi:hypothetical protein